MQAQVKKGQAPRGVQRVDPPHRDIPGQQPHIHFGDKYQSLNIDGTWGHEGGKAIPTLTREIIEWLISNGWGIPAGY